MLTEEILQIPKVQNQKIVADPSRDILLLTVVNRYRPAKPALAFIQGFGLQQGALASSVAHDSHNIIAVGTDADLVCKAVNSIITAKGGIAVATPTRRRITALAYCRTHERFGWRFGGRTLCRTRSPCQADGLRSARTFYDLVLYGAAGDPEFKIKRSRLI